MEEELTSPSCHLVSHPFDSLMSRWCSDLLWWVTAGSSRETLPMGSLHCLGLFWLIMEWPEMYLLAGIICFDLQCACSWKQESFKSRAHFALHETSGLLSAADHWSQASSQNKHGHVTEQERSAAGNLAINPLPLISFPHPFFWFNSWMWPRDPAGSSGCGPIWLTYTWLPPSYSHDSWLEERYFLYNSFFSCSSLCWRSYFARAKRTEVSKHTCRTVCM